MKKFIVLFVVFILVLGVVNLVYVVDIIIVLSDSKLMMMYYKGGLGQYDMMFKGLNLIDVQKQQICDIMKSQCENMKCLFFEECCVMYDLIVSDIFDKVKVEVQIDKMEVQYKVMVLFCLEMQNKIYNILILEQKKQFNVNFEKYLIECNVLVGKMFVFVE